MRDQQDVMSFFQINTLCDAFTDVNRFQVSETEMLVEQKITELYSDIQDMLGKKQGDILDKLNSEFLKSQTQYRATQLMQDRDPISPAYFMDGLSTQNKVVTRSFASKEKELKLNNEAQAS